MLYVLILKELNGEVFERLNLNKEREDDEDCGSLLVNLPWPQKLPEESRELSRLDEERRGRGVQQTTSRRSLPKRTADQLQLKHIETSFQLVVFLFGSIVHLPFHLPFITLVSLLLLEIRCLITRRSRALSQLRVPGHLRRQLVIADSRGWLNSVEVSWAIRSHACSLLSTCAY